MKTLNNNKKMVNNKFLSGKEVFAIFQAMGLPVSTEAPHLDTNRTFFKKPFPENSANPIFEPNTPYVLWKLKEGENSYVLDIKSGHRAFVPESIFAKEAEIKNDVDINKVKYKKDFADGMPRFYPVF